MLLGRFEEAWRISDAVLSNRSPADTDRPGVPAHLRHVWNGAPLRDKSVLIRCYHGLGDTIQFVRCAPMLRPIARFVAVQAQPALLPLLETMRGIDKLLPLDWETPPPPRDVTVEVMELPHALRLTLADLPGEIPYVWHPAASAIRMRDRLRVGIVWSAGEWDPRRSLTLRLLGPLAAIPEISWVSLQRGGAETELHRGVGPRVENPDDRSLDICSTAALISGLDLVISVDTMVAHLAGAMGKPVWVLLHHDADWRWLRDREDCPWYPTMRLFRQVTPSDWREPVARVAERLKRLTRPKAELAR